MLNISITKINKKKSVLPCLEIFYSIQGEGFYSGTAAWFIRLAGCSVGCTWCDSKNSWYINPHQLISVKEIVKKVVTTSGRLTTPQWVVITGGEPLEHDLSSLTAGLRESGCNLMLETSGVMPLSGDWDWITCSPKKFKPPVASVLKKADELKVVIYHPSDLTWATSFISLLKNNCRLSLQPEWSKRDSMIPVIVDYVKRNPQWHISLQTHKYMNVS